MKIVRFAHIAVTTYGRVSRIVMKFRDRYSKNPEVEKRENHFTVETLCAGADEQIGRNGTES